MCGLIASWGIAAIGEDAWAPIATARLSHQ
jgi:hypothetical protein